MRTRLKLMEYNAQDLFVQLAYPVSAADLQGLSERHWQLVGAPDVRLKPLVQLHGLAHTLREEDPDVVLLCEVGGMESLSHFARLFLGDTYEPYLIPGTANRGIGNGFLVRRGLPLRVEVRSHRALPTPFRYPHEDAAGDGGQALSDSLGLLRPEERTISRDLAELRLFAPSEGISGAPILTILLAHLKSAYDPFRVDPGGDTRRAAEVLALLAAYDALCDELGAGAPILIAGDLNGNASRTGTAKEFLPIYERGHREQRGAQQGGQRGYPLIDALELAGVPAYDRITHLSFFLDQISARQLDYLLLPPALHGRLVPGGTYVHRYRLPGDADPLLFPMSLRERSRLPSDHYPIVCSLDLGG